MIRSVQPSASVTIGMAGCLTDFRGDFDQLSIMMEKSWSQNRTQPLRYTEEFLKSCFLYPGTSYQLAPTIYHGSNPVAFVAGFPRRIRFIDKELKIVVITFLTVAEEYKKKGYGIVLWSEVVKRARTLGFDGMVNYCVEGEAMNGMIIGCCKRLGLPVQLISSIPYLTSVLWPKPPCDQVTGVDASIVNHFLDAALSIDASVPLARLWTWEEAQWQCNRTGAVIARHEGSSRDGMITGYVMELADSNRTNSLLVEDIFWGSLETHERVALVKQLTAKAAGRGAQLAVLPVLGYADVSPFRAARFRPSLRVLHAYLTLWNDSPNMSPLPAFYMDVF